MDRQPAEKVIRLAAKMYDCRRSLQFLYDGQYDRKMHRWRELIRAVMKKYSCDALEAVIRLSKTEDLDGVTILHVTAAAVDISESAS